jgi:hypothetical protein
MWVRVRHPTGKSVCYANVTVCDAWKNFAVFLSDMGAPEPGFSLDRIDNEKGYEKENCRWVRLAHQAKNTRRNRIAVFDGKRAIISDHARDRGLDPDVVFDRINKLGWDVDRALRTPVRRQRRRQIDTAGGIALVVNEDNAADVAEILKDKVDGRT